MITFDFLPTTSLDKSTEICAYMLGPAKYNLTGLSFYSNCFNLKLFSKFFSLACGFNLRPFQPIIQCRQGVGSYTIWNHLAKCRSILCFDLEFRYMRTFTFFISQSNYCPSYDLESDRTISSLALEFDNPADGTNATDDNINSHCHREGVANDDPSSTLTASMTCWNLCLRQSRNIG